MTEIKIGRSAANRITVSFPYNPAYVRKVLLICGILYSLLYAGIDVLAGTLYAGYSFTSQVLLAEKRPGAFR